tara:strand:+ start:148 stop:489 length:342 start_codon:yes stop_codon:yes gene_type:complete
LDEVFKQHPGHPDHVVPFLVPYTYTQLRLIEVGCPELERLVVVRDPQECALEDFERRTLYETIATHSEELPSLFRCLTVCGIDAVFDCHNSQMEPFGWANFHEWVIPNGSRSS